MSTCLSMQEMMPSLQVTSRLFLLWSHENSYVPAFSAASLLPDFKILQRNRADAAQRSSFMLRNPSSTIHTTESLHPLHSYVEVRRWQGAKLLTWPYVKLLLWMSPLYFKLACSEHVPVWHRPKIQLARAKRFAVGGFSTCKRLRCFCMCSNVNSEMLSICCSQ